MQNTIRPHPPPASRKTKCGPTVHTFTLLPKPFPLHVETRASLEPLLRLHHPVPVTVRTQVTVSRHPASREILQQHPHQHPQRMALLRRARIRRPTVGIQSPFVAHPDARSVETPGMCTRSLHRTHRADQAVPAHIIMIAAPVESPAAVLPFQVLRRERHPRRRSRAVHHNQVHLPHSAPPFREEPFEPLKMQNTHFNNRMIIHFIPIRNKH